ncbi:MAG TPA: hypothetical protein VJB08_00295 [Candidatus Nanoarchaeia archaeon]|nr:hypothetical protein [Candidatus Nanoarchaeia archaeon]
MIEYSKHLELRLKIRKIPKDYPNKIYKNPDQRFFDNVEGREIAIKKLYYNKKVRNMMIAYEEQDNKIITIHPLTDEKIINRVLSGRWTRK